MDELVFDSLLFSHFFAAADSACAHLATLPVKLLAYCVCASRVASCCSVFWPFCKILTWKRTNYALKSCPWTLAHMLLLSKLWARQCHSQLFSRGDADNDSPVCDKDFLQTTTLMSKGNFTDHYRKSSSFWITLHKIIKTIFFITCAALSNIFK